MKISLIFPGQGSQSVGMLSDLAPEHAVIQQTFEEASEALGYDVWALSQNGPEDHLNQTEFTQPALLAAGIAIWRVWQSLSLTKPMYLAGHSLGEYTALVAANALEFADALQLVRARGQFMQAAVKPGEGAMAAIIGLADDQVSKLCDEVREQAVLSPANFNSIGQVVVAGHAPAVERMVAAATAAGAKLAKVIPVSVPSHCALMQPAAEKLQSRLEEITLHTPDIPVIHNADVAMHTDPADIKSALVKQLFSPVRWVETVQWLESQGIKHLFEAGPGKVLSGINKRITREITSLPLGTAKDFARALEQCEEVN